MSDIEHACPDGCPAPKDAPSTDHIPNVSQRQTELAAPPADERVAHEKRE